MNKSLTTNTLALCLLITIVQTTQSSTPNNPPSYWQIAVNIFFGDSQPEPANPQSTQAPISITAQAPISVTAQDYVTQLRSDLNGSTNQNRLPVIPWNEVNEIEQALKEELHLVDVRNIDYVNQIIRSILISHVKTKTIMDLNDLKREGFIVTAQDYQEIPNSNESNMLARLNRMPHLSGQAIAQYFGQQRRNATRQSILNRSNTFNPFDPSGSVYQ